MMYVSPKVWILGERMSSTNRRCGVRSKHDHYETPWHTLMSLLDNHEIKYPLLEPCAGYGSVANILKLGGAVITNDIDPDMECDYNHDYLDWTPENEFETILTNPPFNIAEQIIKKSIQDLEIGGEVIMLLRLDFLGTEKRRMFWKENPAKQIYALSKRPRFIRSGGSNEYGWYVWENGWTGGITLNVI